MGMIRVNYSQKNKKEVIENEEAKLNLIVSEKGASVIILNSKEISKIYFSQSRSFRNIRTSLDETQTRRTFSI